VVNVRSQEDELKNYIIRMSLDKDVRMGLVIDVKQQLREAKALQIKYKTKHKSTAGNK